MIFEELLVLRDETPHAAALNMALDEVLLRAVSVPTLRLYRWAGSAVSFGYFGRYEEVRRAWPEREMVRRWTGGGVVPHGDDFTYSLMVPRGHALARVTAAESYRAIHEAVAQALAGSATLAGAAAAPSGSACFENPVTSDVLIAGRKAAGAAQRRTSAGMLHQGSVQLASGTCDSEVFAERLIAALSETPAAARWSQLSSPPAKPSPQRSTARPRG